MYDINIPELRKNGWITIHKIDIKYDQNEFIGNNVLIADDNERNSYDTSTNDTLTQQLYKYDVVHLIYGTESTTLNLSIDIIQYTSPIPPSV